MKELIFGVEKDEQVSMHDWCWVIGAFGSLIGITALVIMAVY